MTCGYFQSMDVTAPVTDTRFLTSKAFATLGRAKAGATDALATASHVTPAAKARRTSHLPRSSVQCRAGGRPMRKHLLIGLAMLGLVAATAPLGAHHSFAAEYDANKPVT